MFICLLLVVGMQDVWAQRTLTGKVTDKKNVPIPNASVNIKGSTVGTVTDKNGNFSLSLETVSPIVVTFGSETQEVATKATDKNIVVKFKSSLKDLLKKMGKESEKPKKKKKGE